MSTAEKVELVKGAAPEFGLQVALDAAQLPRSTWYYQRQRKSLAERYEHLREPLEEIARLHPEYGYRRTTVELRETYNLVVNHKVVQKLHRLWDLPLLRTTRRPKPSAIREAIDAAGDRVNLLARMPEVGPFEVLCTDFTEVVYGDGVANLITIIDHEAKLAYGWAVGESANTELALTAWDRAKATLEELGVPITDMVMHHDQDAVFTGHDWVRRLLVEDGLRLSYTLNGAKDNTVMESFYSRFKGENHSLLADVQGLQPLDVAVGERMLYHNQVRRHSTLGYVAPMTYVELLTPGGSTQ